MKQLILKKQMRMKFISAKDLIHLLFMNMRAESVYCMDLERETASCITNRI